jgi:hypothetical protein
MKGSVALAEFQVSLFISMISGGTPPQANGQKLKTESGKLNG